MDTEPNSDVYDDNQQDKMRINIVTHTYESIHTMYIEYRVLTQLYGIQGELVNTGPLLIDQIDHAEETILHVISAYARLPITIINQLHCYLHEYYSMKQFVANKIV